MTFAAPYTEDSLSHTKPPQPLNIHILSDLTSALAMTTKNK